jgi:hypothetical protein
MNYQQTLLEQHHLCHNVFIFANALSVVDAEIDINGMPTKIIIVNAVIAKLHLFTFLLCMLPYKLNYAL